MEKMDFISCKGKEGECLKIYFNWDPSLAVDVYIYIHIKVVSDAPAIEKKKNEKKTSK